jgi:hypothetical protein
MLEVNDMNLLDNDEWTTAILSNPEVLAMPDLWLRKDAGRQERFTVELPPNDCILVCAK